MENLVKQIKRRYLITKSFNWPKNWVLKLLSLFFAIFLWYFVVGEDKVDTSVFIPVEIVNLPRNLVISNQFKKQLEVTVSGPRGLIDGIRRQPISRTINLSKATPGTIVIHNEPASIPFPRGISVLRIQPSHVTLLIDRLIEKNLPIEAAITGKPARDYELAAVQFDPATINVSGPQAIVGKVTRLVTEPIDISGLAATTTKQTTLNLSPEIADLIGETVVSTRVVIKEKSVEKSVRNIPLILTNKAEGLSYRLPLKKIRVKAQIPISLARGKKDLPKRFKATLDASGLGPGKHEIAVAVASEKSIKIIEVTPKTVTVDIKSPGGKTKHDGKSGP